LVKLSRLVWIAVLCLPLGAALWAQDSEPQTAPAKPQLAPERREGMRRLLPTPLPVGAVAQGPAEFYLPGSLYQYMDGGADIFVEYQLKAMLHQDAKAGRWM
jgi:hypothetical protein